MTNILILGANGQLAQLVRKNLVSQEGIQLFLLARHPVKFASGHAAANEKVISADVLDTEKLASAMSDNQIDIVYSSVGGVDLDQQTASMIKAMDQAKVTRLVFISASGAHHEIPGKFGVWNEQAIADYLPGFRKSADLLENSDIDYTMIRPAWLTDKDEIDYELTGRHDLFKGTEVSRKSVADLVSNILTHPERFIKNSLGINKPNTDGDKPAWFED